MKQRLDVLLVQRGLATSRTLARAFIMSGRVTVDGARQDKPGTPVAEASEVAVAPSGRTYASRGGFKLEGALDRFGLDVAGRRCLDIGASTGGFTDCLLKRGALHIVALDVGRGQLDWDLRNDPRVTVKEGINARYLEPGTIPWPADLVVVDVSFIGLGHILPRIPPLMAEGGEALPLVKPQFEVGPGKVSKGGMVGDPALRLEAVVSAAAAAAAAGMAVTGLCRSSLEGAEGNIEYFLHLRTRREGLAPSEIEDHARELIEEEAGGD